MKVDHGAEEASFMMQDVAHIAGDQCGAAKKSSLRVALMALKFSAAETMVLALIPNVMILDHYGVNTVRKKAGRRRFGGMRD